MTESIHAAFALLPSGLEENVRLELRDGRWSSITVGVEAEPRDKRCRGVVLPGLANAHGHGFHRALRGRTQLGRGTFWTWRIAMYELARRITPEQYYKLALGLYCEMATAGITTVGEFHYLHRTPQGHPYRDPNEMGLALKEAAHKAGIRLTLLDTLYLAGGLESGGHTALNDTQRRFTDDSVEGWQVRVAQLRDDQRFKVGSALHSIRAVARPDLIRVSSEVARSVCHIHLSEQREENELCAAYYGCTPTQLLADTGLLTSTTVLVHATHTQRADRDLIERSQSQICLCPSTEADLADGLAPVSELRDRGIALCLGTDQHVFVDLFREVQLLEGGERLRTESRGHLDGATLIDIASRHGHQSLGWDDVGELRVGFRADLVEIRLDSPSTAGVEPAQILFAVTRSDVVTVLVDGVTVVDSGQHVRGDIGKILTEAIAEIWG